MRARESRAASTRDEGRADALADPDEPMAEQLRQPGCREHVRGEAAVRAAAAERNRVIGETRGEVQVVEHHDDRPAALARERRHDLQRRDLLAEIEMRRWLVEQEELRVLGDERGVREAPPLATG
jgi:hypothetical protein